MLFIYLTACFLYKRDNNSIRLRSPFSRCSDQRDHFHKAYISCIAAGRSLIQIPSQVSLRIFCLIAARLVNSCVRYISEPWCVDIRIGT